MSYNDVPHATPSHFPFQTFFLNEQLNIKSYHHSGRSNIYFVVAVVVFIYDGVDKNNT